jgi:hypothetical protein
LNLQIAFENDASPSKPVLYLYLTSDLEMNLETYYDCLSKGVTEHFPFDEDALVFKVGGKYMLYPH